MTNLSNKYERIIICTIFLLAGLILLPIYKYQINPDGIAYLSIARHYSRGNWMDALNSCWPPFLSWMLAPWFRLVEEPLWIFKIYNILAGTGCLWMSHSILCFFKLKRIFAWPCLAILFAYFSMWSFNLTTPDLMSVFMMLVYGYWVLNGRIYQRPVMTGLLGALLYFVKSYCFFFFIAHLSFQYVLQAILEKRNYLNFIRKYAITVFFFLLVSCSWMYLLSLKYGKFAVSSASAWTHGMLKYPNLSCVGEFVPPPNQNAVFAWEDPPLLCAHRDWSMFASWENFKFQWNTFFRNTSYFLFTLQKENSYANLVGFLLMVLALFLERREGAWRRRPLGLIWQDPLFQLIPIILIYTFGYLLIFIEPRYVWISYTLVAIGSFVSLQRLSGQRFSAGFRAWLIMFGLVAVLIGGIIMRYPKMLVPLLSFLRNERANDKGYQFYKQSQQIRNQISYGSSMAIWGANDAVDRAQSWNLAYYARMHHYGVLPMDTTEAKNLIQRYRLAVITISLENSHPPSFIERNWKRIYPDAGGQAVYLSLSALPGIGWVKN